MVVFGVLTGIAAAGLTGGPKAVHVVPKIYHAIVDSSLPPNEQLANKMAGQMGWGAGEQSCLDKLWSEESARTWSPTVQNPTSGALGVPQALGHGDRKGSTAGTHGNQYGAQYGLTVSQAVAANSGDIVQQLRWGLGYIKVIYKTPCLAWAFEISHVPNWY